MTIKKNVFIEGLANYRDFLHVHQRLTPRMAWMIFVYAIVIPGSIGAVSTLYEKRMAENRRLLFPERNGALESMK